MVTPCDSTVSEVSEKENLFEAENGKFPVIGQIKEMYKKMMENDLNKSKMPTNEELKEILIKTINERANADPDFSVDPFHNDFLSSINNEDQFATFVACCAFMANSNAAMREMVRIVLSTISQIKQTHVYQASMALQTVPIYEDEDDNEIELNAWDDEIARNDPKEQQKNKKKTKKRKIKKPEDDEFEEYEVIERRPEFIPKLEELLHSVDQNEGAVQEEDPSVPKVSPEEADIPQKAKEIGEIINNEIFQIVNLISSTNITQQAGALNREIFALEKKTAATAAALEKRESEVKASIKELLGKSEQDARELQRLEAQIQSLEAEIERAEQRKDDTVKEIEKVDDNTLSKYKAQWQNTISRFHSLEEEVKNVSCSIRREKQAVCDQTNAAKKEEEALKKEIEILESTLEKKQAQLASCEIKIEKETERHEEEHKNLLLNIKGCEMLIRKTMSEKEQKTEESLSNPPSSRQSSNESVLLKTDQSSRSPRCYPIGVIPPNYVQKEEKERTYPDQRFNRYLSNGRAPPNYLGSDLYYVDRPPHRCYPIGVIPPYYIKANEHTWIPPPKRNVNF